MYDSIWFGIVERQSDPYAKLNSFSAVWIEKGVEINGSELRSAREKPKIKMVLEIHAFFLYLVDINFTSKIVVSMYRIVKNPEIWLRKYDSVIAKLSGILKSTIAVK